MLKSEIKPRTEYALREKRSPTEPLQRVRILEHIRGNKWKAEWIEPNPGLKDYVESGQLICAWKEQKAFLKEESDAHRLRDHNREQGYDSESHGRVMMPQSRNAKLKSSDSNGWFGMLCMHSKKPVSIPKWRGYAGRWKNAKQAGADHDA